MVAGWQAYRLCWLYDGAGVGSVMKVDNVPSHSSSGTMHDLSRPKDCPAKLTWWMICEAQSGCESGIDG